MLAIDDTQYSAPRDIYTGPSFEEVWTVKEPGEEAFPIPPLHWSKFIPFTIQEIMSI